MFKNITQTQWIAFVIGACSFLGGATAQLTELFGSHIAANVASVCGLISGVSGVFLMATTGQSSQVLAVRSMPGVAKIEINEQANQTLAALAVDPKMDKIAPTREALQQVTTIAKGTS